MKSLGNLCGLIAILSATRNLEGWGQFEFRRQRKTIERITEGDIEVTRYGGRRRRRYGSACLRGLATVEAMIAEGQPAPTIIVFVDADHSDHAEQLPLLVTPIFDGQADFVLGSRMLGSRMLGEREPGAMPFAALFGNRLACFLMRVLFGARFTDLGPFRAIAYDKLRALAMCDTNYGWTIEMQIKAARAGLRHLEIPVPYRRRIGVSKISGTISGVVKAGTKILWTIARYGGTNARQ